MNSAREWREKGRDWQEIVRLFLNDYLPKGMKDFSSDFLISVGTAVLPKFWLLVKTHKYPFVDQKGSVPLGLFGGGGVQVCGVGLVVFVSGVGGPQVKKSPLQPILGVGEGRPPMMAASGRHQQHVTPMQLNGVPARLPGLPQGRPRLHRHLVVL